MKTMKITAVLSMGAIVGFFAGLIYSLNHVITNHYLQYRMYQLIALNLQKNFNKWVMLSILFFVLSFIIIVVLLTSVKCVARLLFPRILKLENLNGIESKLGNVSLCISCVVFSICGGWMINHYWLPPSFNNWGFLSYAGILLFTIFLGWVWMKKKEGKLYKLIRIKALFILVAVLFLNLYVVIDNRRGAHKGPNVIFILIDCLRPDHLGCYGYKRDTSPTIDRLAQEGIIFTNAYCNAPWTKPSMASIFTSLYPNVHKVINYSNVLPDGVLTIAEILKTMVTKHTFLMEETPLLKKNLTLIKVLISIHSFPISRKTRWI